MSIRNEMLVYVSDQVAAIPTLQNNQFTLSTLEEYEDDSVGGKIDAQTVVDAIREFLDSIGEGRNFAVIANDDVVTIASVSGKSIDRDPEAAPEEAMFSCSHCGFVTRYETELHVHMRIHYF